MEFYIKKYAIVAVDVVIIVYLYVSMTAFNSPDVDQSVCNDVKITISKSPAAGFLNVNEIKGILLCDSLYPLGQRMRDVNVRAIEECLAKNKLIKDVECYKTQDGHVRICLTQYIPVMRVMADNGDDYYLDSHGNVIEQKQYSSNLVVATGHISKTYASKILTPIGNSIATDKFWNNMILQINVLDDKSIELIPRVGDHIIYIGAPVHFRKKLDRLEKFYKYGLNKVGWNKYSRISLEIENQIICKKKKKHR